MKQWKQEVLDSFEQKRASKKRDEMDFWESTNTPRTFAQTLFLSLAIVAATATLISLLIWM
jgi:hypothetical protein